MHSDTCGAWVDRSQDWWKFNVLLLLRIITLNFLIFNKHVFSTSKTLKSTVIKDVIEMLTDSILK